MDQTQDIRLPARAVHSIADAAGVQLRCHEGALWLTLDHDPRDVIIEAGETYVGTEHRRAIVYALGDARFSQEPQPSGTPLATAARRGWAVPGLRHA